MAEKDLWNYDKANASRSSLTIEIDACGEKHLNIRKQASETIFEARNFYPGFALNQPIS